MNDEEFDAFLASCCQALAVKQAELDGRYGLTAQRRWHFDDHEGVLIFFGDDGRAQLRFAVTPIGTYAANQETWKWAWANGHIEQPLRDKAQALQGLFGVTDYECFIEAEPFAVDEGMAWELAAAAVHQLGALGCYRAPNREIQLFLALDRLL